MKVLVIALAASVAIAASVSAQQRNGGYGAAPSYPTYGTGSNSSSHGTSGYTTNRGTYVDPHQQTNPNATQYDNYNSRGNYNPSNGQTGKRSPKW